MPFTPQLFYLTLFLFVAAVAVCHFYFPNREERDAFIEYYKSKRAHKNIRRQIEDYENQINVINDENRNIRMANAALLEYGGKLETVVINFARGCYNVWMKHNLMHRSDNCRPTCFDQPYPFKFTTHFPHFNN